MGRLSATQKPAATAVDISPRRHRSVCRPVPRGRRHGDLFFAAIRGHMVQTCLQGSSDLALQTENACFLFHGNTDCM